MKADRAIAQQSARFDLLSTTLLKARENLIGARKR
jgi:hypothetical protein